MDKTWELGRFAEKRRNRRLEAKIKTSTEQITKGEKSPQINNLKFGTTIWAKHVFLLAATSSFFLPA